MRDDGVNCEVVQRAMREEHELTKAESAHLEECDECMDKWLTLALDAKPEVAIPVDFAARVAAGLPVRQPKRAMLRSNRHWGLITALAILTVLMVVCFAGPAPANPPANSWIGPVFLFLVTTEIVGLALWLAPKWLGR